MSINGPMSCRYETPKISFEHSLLQEPIVRVKSETLLREGSFVKESFETFEGLSDRGALTSFRELIH